MTQTCEKCGGTGELAKATGVKRRLIGSPPTRTSCPLCKGTGVIVSSVADDRLFPLTFDDVCPPSAPTEGDT
jgi:DnaJ-class molecular chaperone